MPGVIVTRHAATRAEDRCGLDWLSVVRQVVSSDGHRANETETWVSIVGPKGRGTAIVQIDPACWKVITVRDAHSATQAEDTTPLTASMRDAAGESFAKLLADWEEAGEALGLGFE